MALEVEVITVSGTVDGIGLTAGSPPCHEELSELIAAEIILDPEVPLLRDRKRHPHVHCLDLRRAQNAKMTCLHPRTED